MRAGRDKVGARTSDAHVEEFLRSAEVQLSEWGNSSMVFLATDHQPMRSIVSRRLNDRVIWLDGSISFDSSGMKRAFIEMFA